MELDLDKVCRSFRWVEERVELELKVTNEDKGKETQGFLRHRKKNMMSCSSNYIKNSEMHKTTFVVRRVIIKNIFSCPALNLFKLHYVFQKMRPPNLLILYCLRLFVIV